MEWVDRNYGPSGSSVRSISDPLRANQILEYIIQILNGEVINPRLFPPVVVSLEMDFEK